MSHKRIINCGISFLMKDCQTPELKMKKNLAITALALGFLK